MANIGTWRSITQVGTYEPFDLQVARGQIAGHSPVVIYGYSTAIGSTALGPVWEGQTQSGGLAPYPGSAAQLVLVSDNAADTSAKSVLISGLDANYKPITETIALNGTSNVTTTNSFLRINGMKMANSLNTGVITAKISTTVYAQINAGIGSSQASIFTVPAGYTFYLTYIQADASIGFTSSNYMILAEYNKDNSTGATTYNGQSVYVQYYNQPFTVPVAHPEKMDMQFLVKANSGSPFTVDIYAGGYLIQNAIQGSNG